MNTSIKTMLFRLAASSLLLLSASALAATQADFDKVYAAAEASVKKAASMKNEWRDSGKILKKAQEAAKAGNFDNGISLARTAEFQGEVAQSQAAAQASAGNPGYMYK